MKAEETNTVSDEELDQLLASLFDLYGYDFTNYARASLKRRVNRLIVMGRFSGFAELFSRIKYDPGYLQKLIEALTVNVTEMFRDPATFKKIKEDVLPVLATHPFIRIWHAGCSTGEEVYSMAILLEEANLLHKSLIYATDLNPSVIENIRRGIFPISQMKQYSENYIAAGGKREFSGYYTAKYDWAKFNETLTARMIVASHNLVSDRSFNEFQLIFCRNVLIYFDKELQEKTLALFDDSLESLGYLVLGSRESIRFSKLSKNFIQPDNNIKIWRKMS